MRAVLALRPLSLEGEVAVSTVTIAELHCGVLVAKDATARAERLRRLSVIQSMFTALPVDDAVAQAQIPTTSTRPSRPTRSRAWRQVMRTCSRPTSVPGRW